MSKRKPGVLGGQQGGPPSVSSTRARRLSQKDSQSTGDRLGSGLRTDKQGRIAVKQIPAMHPDDPNFQRLLVQHLQAIGLMER